MELPGPPVQPSHRRPCRCARCDGDCDFAVKDHFHGSLVATRTLFLVSPPRDDVVASADQWGSCATSPASRSRVSSACRSSVDRSRAPVVQSWWLARRARWIQPHTVHTSVSIFVRDLAAGLTHGCADQRVIAQQDPLLSGQPEPDRAGLSVPQLRTSRLRPRHAASRRGSPAPHGRSRSGLRASARPAGPHQARGQPRGVGRPRTGRGSLGLRFLRATHHRPHRRHAAATDLVGRTRGPHPPAHCTHRPDHQGANRPSCPPTRSSTSRKTYAPMDSPSPPAASFPASPRSPHRCSPPASHSPGRRARPARPARDPGRPPRDLRRATGNHQGNVGGDRPPAQRIRIPQISIEIPGQPHQVMQSAPSNTSGASPAQSATPWQALRSIFTSSLILPRLNTITISAGK